MVTVEPDAKLRLSVSPAGTVKLLMTTVVHLTASDTSSKEEMVPVQSEAAGAALAAITMKERARSDLKCGILSIQLPKYTRRYRCERY